MPFVKKNDSKNLQLSTHTLFIGRNDELVFFTQNILKPVDPTHNIISISGQGGVGKSTLLMRLIDEAHSSIFKEYCLTAIVDERQTTPANIMEKFADQLHLTGEFDKALNHYKEVLRKLHSEQETMPQTFLQGLPDVAGAVVEGIPVAGPLLREGAKLTATHLLRERNASRIRRDAEFLDNPIEDLTRAFVTDLNRLANTNVTNSSTWEKRERRILLFFDTFEHLAAEASPWLLDHLLKVEISSNVVLVVAGRDSLESSTPNDPKRWLPYYEYGTIYGITLNSFTEQETYVYLESRGITNPVQIDAIWQLSRGLPLFLGLLTSRSQEAVDPTKNVIDNFLRWIPEEEHVKRRLALHAALFSRPFNQDDLDAFEYIAEHEHPILYRWLTEQPFVRRRPQDGRYLYHEIAQELFSRHLCQLSPRECEAMRRVLANCYRQQLEKIQAEEGAYDTSEWLETAQAIVCQLFLLPDEASHIKAIEQILYIYKYTDTEQGREISKILRDLGQERPNNQANASARKTARHLLLYIEPYQANHNLLATIDYLLERVAQAPSFSPELLATIYRRRGNLYANRREEEEAISNYNRALDFDPTVTWTYILRGNAYRWLGEYQKAIKDFDHALELNPKNAWAYAERAVAYLERAEYERALEDCNRALELDPKDGWVYICRSMVYRDLGDYQRAIEDCNRALELDPKQASRAYFQRGLNFMELKDYRRAIQDFDQGIEQDASYDRNYIGRARAHGKLKEYQQAIQDFDQVIKLSPRYARAYSQRAFLHLRMHDTHQAFADYIRCWELGVKDVNAGWMAQWSKMCQESADSRTVEYLEEIAALDITNYIAYICRGVAQWLRGNYEQSLAELEQAVTINPGEWDAFFWKGMVCASLEKNEEAMAMFEMSLALELPPVLLTPLHCFEQDRPDFYKKYAEPLLKRYER